MNLLLYCIHSRLVLHADKDNIIMRSKIWRILGETYHIPKELRNKCINELLEDKVLVGSGKGYYIINRSIKPIAV